MESVPYEAGIADLFGWAASESEALRKELLNVKTELEAFASDLAARRPEVHWRSEGLTVDSYPLNPERQLSAYVEADDLTFCVELSPGRFYPNLSREPSAYYVEAEVYVVSDAPVDHGQDCVHELPAVGYKDAQEAVGGLLRAV